MEIISEVSFEAEKRYRLVFIGHSFGARMVLHGLQDYIDRPSARTFFFLSDLQQLQLVLLNAAVGEYSLLSHYNEGSKALRAFELAWSAERFEEELISKHGEDILNRDRLVDLDRIRMIWAPTITELAYYTDVRVFNVLSRHDLANKYLYPYGSLIGLDSPDCAIGACGLSQWNDTVDVSPSGSMTQLPDLKRSNVWNVDASNVINSHSDIYKGRVANLLWELLSLSEPTFSQSELELNDREEEPVAEAFWWIQRGHRASMKAVNRARTMSIKEKLERKRLNSLLFDLDVYLRHEHWGSAQTLIHKLMEIPYCTPGWWWQLNVGLVRRGVLHDHQDAYITEGRVCGWPQLKLVLAIIHAKLDNCSYALQLLDDYKNREPDLGTQVYQTIGNHVPLRYKLDVPRQFVRDACHAPEEEIEYKPFVPPK
jgi:hypothetical protein